MSPDLDSVAVVARNSDGEIMGMWGWVGPPISSEAAEAFAVFKAIQVAIQMRWQKVVLESDCEVVIKVLSSVDDTVAANWDVAWDTLLTVDDIKKLLSSFGFVNISFAWVSRIINKLAHFVCSSLAELDCFLIKQNLVLGMA